MKYYIDRRPLWLLILKEYKNACLLLISLILFFVFIMHPWEPQGMSLEAYRAGIIFCLAIFLWVSNIIPLAITSLAVMGLLATFKVLDSDVVYGFFGNEAVFFIIGAFIISAGISKSGLNERLTYYVIRRFGQKADSLVLSIFFLSAFLSHLMPSHAVAAVLFPILMTVAKQLRLEKDSVLARYMFFALAWGAVIGSIVTFLGGARNPLAVGILEETTGQNIRFLEWMIAVGPPTYVIMIGTAIYLKIKVKASQKDTKSLKESFSDKRQALGKIRFSEIKALLILVGTVYMWVFQSQRFGIANIALISAALFFALNVIGWEDARHQINWGAVFMYGGAIALGKSLVETGLLEYISTNYLLKWQVKGLFFLIIAFVIGLILTEGVSNTAVVVILLPVLLQMSTQVGMNPKAVVYVSGISAGLSLMFPMSSPPNAIAFTSGFIKTGQAVKHGLIIKGISLVLFCTMTLLYWKLIGII